VGSGEGWGGGSVGAARLGQGGAMHFRSGE